MKNNNRTYYVMLVLVGLTVWITETAYFGFNEKPQSGVEKILDTVSWLFIFWGVAGDIVKTTFSGVEYHKHEGDMNFPKAKNVEINHPSIYSNSGKKLESEKKLQNE